jgi:hypothetical protein
MYKTKRERSETIDELKTKSCDKVVFPLNGHYKVSEVRLQHRHTCTSCQQNILGYVFFFRHGSNGSKGWSKNYTTIGQLVVVNDGSWSNRKMWITVVSQ